MTSRSRALLPCLLLDGLLSAICISPHLQAVSNGVLYVNSNKPGFQQKAPFYHTSEHISKKLQTLANSGRCKMDMDVRRNWVTPYGATSSEKMEFDVVTLRGKSDNSAIERAHRAFFLFGEHAREMISVESGFHFIKTLCARGLGELPVAITIIPNANPWSRRLVEQGEFCRRTNERDVDLNRNWDDHWIAEDDNADTYPGRKPFSEVETRYMRDLVKELDPNTFVTVHSGTLAMFMPYAYTTKEPSMDANRATMLKVLETLDERFCHCPFGSAGQQIGYESHGACLDWVYDNTHAKNVFGFEIFAAKASRPALRERWQQCKREARKALLAYKEDKRDASSIPAALYMDQEKEDLSEPFDCFAFFNPTKIEEFTETLENWTSAYISLLREVVKEQ